MCHQYKKKFVSLYIMGWSDIILFIATSTWKYVAVKLIVILVIFFA